MLYTSPDLNGVSKRLQSVQPIRAAATIVLVRSALDGFEIFMVRRTTRAVFGGGMYVFPGGRVDGDDHLQRYDVLSTGPSANQWPQQRALGNEWRGYWIAGIRECFEEAGMLLAYDGEGMWLDDLGGMLKRRLATYRQQVHDRVIMLADVCEKEHLRLAIDRVHYWERWVTPQGSPRRFDTRFFVAQAPERQLGRHDDGETVDSRWITPADAITQSDQGAFGLMSVTRRQLTVLSSYRSAKDLLKTLEAERRFVTNRPRMVAG